LWALCLSGFPCKHPCKQISSMQGDCHRPTSADFPRCARTPSHHVAVSPAPTITLRNHQRHAQGDRGGRGAGVSRSWGGVCVWGYTALLGAANFFKSWIRRPPAPRPALGRDRGGVSIGRPGLPIREPMTTATHTHRGAGANQDRSSFSYPPSLAKRCRGGWGAVSGASQVDRGVVGGTSPTSAPRRF
jgi:hypothetical protein